MSNFFRRLELDRLLPRNIRRDDPEELRRARVAIYFALALFLFSLQYAVIYASDGHYGLALWILGPASLGLLTPLVLRARQPARAAGLYVPTLTLLVLMAAGYSTGGLYSPTTWWGCTIGLLAMLIAGTRVALVMMGVVIVVVIATGHLATSGYPFPTLLDPRDHPGLTVVDAVTLCVVVVVLAWLFERAKDRMFQALNETNAEMKLVLTSVDQGFLCADVNGHIFGHRSAVLSRWFGRAEDGASIASYLAGEDAALATRFALGWSGLADGFLPVEVCLDQLPHRFVRDGRHFAVAYHAVDDESKASFVAVISDVSRIIETERAESRQREWAQALDRAMRDRVGFVRFFEETSDLVRTLAQAPENPKILLHTLKGICGQYGLSSLAATAHEVETGLAEAGRASEQEILALCEDWREFAVRIEPIIQSKGGTLEIARDDYTALKDAVERVGAPSDLADLVRSLSYEPVEVAFARMSEHAQSLARRLGKPAPRVEIESGGVKLDPKTFGALWSAFLHAVRNAVDHGIEAPEDRELQDKPRAGLLRFAASLDREHLCISLEDDGRGVDWEAIARKAELAGLPHGTQAELETALFAEGISTRDGATDVSGRGVGATALEATVRALGGHIEIRSRPTEGMRISLHFEAASRLGAHVTPGETNRAHTAAEVDVPPRGAAA